MYGYRDFDTPASDTWVRNRNAYPLVSPNLFLHEIPAPGNATEIIHKGRRECIDVITQKDDRLLVIVGPSAIHDTKAALDYSDRLRALSDELKDDLLILMRAYVENARTTAEWKGLVYDPDLDENFNVNKGLRLARELFKDITERGLPIATGMNLDIIIPNFLGDLICIGCVGKTGTESEPHRALASGLPFPVGFQNGTGDVLHVALDAIKDIHRPHQFLGMDGSGLICSNITPGNEHGFAIWTGYYDEETFTQIMATVEQAQLPGRLMIDCTNADGRNHHRHQLEVLKSLSEQISKGQTGLLGVMILSDLHEGNQVIPPEGASGLKRGVSITHPCIGWEDTDQILRTLADAVKERRKHLNKDASSCGPLSGSSNLTPGARSHRLVWSESQTNGDTSTCLSGICHD